MSSTTQSCEAWLYIFDREYGGSTGNGQGHAEMDALNTFILDCGDDPKLRIASAIGKLNRARKKAVYCPSKPVCKKCSAVLQGLGFTLEKGTEWSTESSDKMTEWGLGLNVQALLKGAGLDYDAIKKL